MSVDLPIMCTDTIMRAIVPLLLCLLSALVEVHSQTVPYVSFMGTNLPNHSYVDLTLVGRPEDGGDSVQCHTDLEGCCSGAQGPDRGDWYFPNGDRLQFSSSSDDIYEFRRAQRVDLQRRNNGDTSGIYRCTIETNAVHSDDSSDTTTRETVYVGLYASGGEDVRQPKCIIHETNAVESRQVHLDKWKYHIVPNTQNTSHN